VSVLERTEATAADAAKGRWLAPTFFLSPAVTSAIARSTWLFFPLTAVALIVPYLRMGNDWRRLFTPIAVIAPMVAIAVYLLVGAIWAAEPSAAIENFGLLLAAMLLVFAASRAIAALDAPRVSQAARAFAIGAFIGGLFVLFELLTDGAITRLFAYSLSWTRPEGIKQVDIVDGEVVKLNPAVFRQSVCLLTFHLWPALLAVSAIADRKRRTLWIGLLAAAIAAPVLFSDRMSSQLALVSSVGVFGLAYISRRAVVRLLAVLWCLGFVLILPAAFLAYKAELHLAPWIPESARARMIIWEFTAERTLERPLLGIGAGSTPALRIRRDQAEQPEGFVYPRTTGAHAHNIFLQTWYELGLLGVVLVAVAGVFLALRILLLPPGAQPFAAGAFTAVLVTLATSWSMWQVWLVCGIGLMLIYLLVAARAPRAAAQA
jgi:O-antigen ligase